MSDLCKLLGGRIASLRRRAGIKLSETTLPREIREYLRALLRSHFDKKCQQIALQPMRTVPDPAVDVVLEAFAGAEKSRLREISELHRKSMAAENKVGELLEAYLASVLEPQGWVWCCGNIIQDVDFFRGNTPVDLLQIKNRSNSENSSSSRIRELIQTMGCPVEIRAWYRIEASNGDTRWQDLPGNSRLTLADEGLFQQFIRDYVTKKSVARKRV